MNKLTFVLTGLLLILITTSASAQVPTEQARAFQANTAHSGSISSPGLVPPLRQKWSINFGNFISYPIIADGRVFVTVKVSGPLFDSRVYAIDAANGAILWTFNLTGESLWSALTYENGRLFASTREGGLRCFDAATGTVLWTKSVGGPFMAPPTAFQGVVYLSGRDNVWAYSQDTGNLLWKSPVPALADSSSPVVTNDAVYVSYSCPHVYKLNRANGAQIWHYGPNCGGAGGKTAVLHNGRLYVRDGVADYLFDSQTGSLLNTFSSTTATEPAFSGNMGFFLYGSPRFGQVGRLEGRDQSNNNALVWTFTGDGFLQSGLLVVNNILYVGSDRGKLYGLDSATGQVVWSTTAGTSIPYVDDHNASRPTAGLAAAEGLLVIPTNTTLVAYEQDDTPPSVTWGAQVPVANASGWNTTAVDLPFTLSGVGTAAPESPLHFTEEGVGQTQSVSLTDRNGNVTNVSSPSINIDRSSPSTSAVISSAPGCGGEWCSSVEITLSASDNVSGVANTFYRVDGGAPQTYTAPFSISSNGTHTVNYWSQDVAGNIESAHSSVVKIDTNAPTTQASATGTAGSNGWHRSTVQVSLNSSDNESGTASTFYSVDGGATQTYTGAFSIDNEGVHQLTFWSVDNIGNTETQRSLAIKIDKNAGTVQSSLSGVLGNLNYYTTPVQVTLTASDAVSGVASNNYRIDGGSTNQYNGAFTVSSDGNHTVEYWTTDNAGNSSATSTVSFKIDRMPPVTQVSFSTNFLGNDGWHRGTVQVSMTATDSQSGVQVTQYRIDNGTLKTYTAPFNYSSNGIHTITYWSVDKVSNTETVQNVQLKIDQQAPSITITATPSSVTASANPVIVTVSGRVTDALSGINPATVFYQVIDEYSVVQPSGPVTLQPNGDFSFTLSFPATKNPGDRQRIYTIQLNAGDMAGVGKSATDTVKIN